MIHFRGDDSRYIVTLDYIWEFIPPQSFIVDLGDVNPLSVAMMDMNHHVLNTDFDLDREPETIQLRTYDWLTSFQVFEHLLNPYTLLKHIMPCKMLCSVPLNVWFSKAHWIDGEPYRQHYHEFERRQFFKLLDHTGWDILFWEERRIVKSVGLRQMLRFIWPSYLFVVAEKVEMT